MTTSNETVTYRRVFSRWIPLALSWSLMSLELPLVQSIVSSLPDSSHNLAALGVTFAICLMCESPILMLVSAGAALVKDWESFRKLRLFSLSLSLLMSIIFGVVSLLLYYGGVLLRISHDDPILAERIFQACLISIVIPLAVGNRRFIQGVLIRSGQSFLLTFGTLTRLFLIVCVGFSLSHFSSMHGAIIGSCAGVAGMIGESLAITILSAKTRRALKAATVEENVLTYSAISKFYSPLAISGVVNLAILPVLTFFMSQSPEPVNSLAAYQVLQGILFFMSALALGLQEVIVSMLGSRHQGYIILRNFTLGLAISVASLFAIYVLTPLSTWVLTQVLGISPALEQFLHPVLILALPIPIVTVLTVAMRAVVVSAKRTRWITAASLSELLTVLAVMLVLQKWGTSSGLWNAVTALMSARFMSLFVLSKIFRDLRTEKSAT